MFGRVWVIARALAADLRSVRLWGRPDGRPTPGDMWGELRLRQRHPARRHNFPCPIKSQPTLCVLLPSSFLYFCANIRLTMNATTFATLATDPSATAAVASGAFPTLHLLGATACAGLATVLFAAWPSKVSPLGCRSPSTPTLTRNLWARHSAR